MKQGWIGVVAGLAIGVAVVFLTSRGRGTSAPVRRPAANAAELVARCTAPLVPTYQRAAAPLREAITSAPRQALDTARGPVTNAIQIRLGVCEQALAAREADRSSAEVSADIARLASIVHLLSVARTRLGELIATLSSPQATDAQRKLDALDAAMRALPDSMTGSAGVRPPAAGGSGG
jgi:hypothetical protein